MKTFLKSGSLHVGRDIDVKHSEKTGNSSLNGSVVGADSSIGSLKVSSLIQSMINIYNLEVF